MKYAEKQRLEKKRKRRERVGWGPQCSVRNAVESFRRQEVRWSSERGREKSREREI